MRKRKEGLTEVGGLGVGVSSVLVSVVEEESSDGDLSSDVPVEREIKGRGRKRREERTKGKGEERRKSARRENDPAQGEEMKNVGYEHELGNESEDRSKLLDEGFGELGVRVRVSSSLGVRVGLSLKFFLRDLGKFDEDEKDGENESETSDSPVEKERREGRSD